jgi:drug/metabolite transporter (DMT)-like permease
MISHILTAVSFGIIPILYKYLLLTNINIISLLIFCKIIIAIFCILLLSIGDNLKNFNKDIVYLLKNKELFLYFILIIILTGFVYVFGQYWYFSSLNNNKTNISTAIIASYPVITLVLSYLYFNETITYYQLLGIFFIFTGLFLIIKDN